MCDIDTLKTQMTNVAHYCGLTFGKAPADKLSGDKWFGVAGPTMNFYIAFGLRLGHDTMVTAKGPAGETCYAVSSFGLHRAHHVMLEGIRFPPERRSSMVQSLGPMTVPLCYLTSKEPYDSKFLTACLRSMAHILNIAKILPALKTKRRADAAPLISRLADILLVTTGRNVCRASPPPNVFATFMVSKTEVQGLQVQTEPMVMSPIIKTTDPICFGGFSPSTLRKVITNSGPSAAALYMSFNLNPWGFPDSFGTQHAAQTVFH